MNIRIILLTLILLELFIGGTGQLFKIYNIPLRQILFSLMLFFFIMDLILLKVTIKINFESLLIIFIVVYSLISSLIGLMKSHNNSIILSDLFPMLYFLMYFPFNSYFKMYNIDKKYIYNLLYISSFIISIAVSFAYYILFTYFKGDIFLFNTAILETFGSEIFWFRHGGWIFYPGLIYVFITITVIIDNFFAKRTISYLQFFIYALGVFAIVISMTKGLILILILSHLIIYFKYKKSLKTIVKSMLVSSLILFYVINNIDTSRLIEYNTDTGVSIRLKTISESADKIENTFIFGNGFGTELQSKKFHQENSYLDILVEQGFLGLLLYIILCTIIFLKRNFNFGLFIAIFSIFLMSFTNPYVNNPLGIGIIILALVLLRNKGIVNEK